MDVSHLKRDAYYRFRPAQLAFRETAYSLPKVIADYGVPAPIEAVYAANIMPHNVWVSILAEEADIRKRREAGEKIW